MRRLSPSKLTVARRLRAQERGAVAVIVALVLGFGVVLGLGAIVIDVGALHQERRIVQNGADAASLALAQICAKKSADPGCNNTAYLKDLAGLNAGDGTTTGDGRTDILSVCGGGSVGAKFGACTVRAVDHLTECVKKAIPAGTNYVQVRTRTQTGSGTLLKPFLAQAIGDKSYDGTEVSACARAAWGPGYPADEVVAITDALCAWKQATNNGLDFPPLPPYANAPNSTPLKTVPVADKYVAKVLLQGAGGSTTDPAKCGKNDTSSGQYVAGNFGWLDVRDGTACAADIDKDTGVVGGNSGAPAGTCGPYLTSKVGSIIYLPVFTSVSGGGSGADYTIDGVAAFFLAGFQAPGDKLTNAYDAGDNKSSTPHCIEKTKLGVSKDNGCMWGWFLAPLAPAGTLGGGTGRGPTTVSVAG